MKNSNDTTGNRTRDLPACSAVPQPTAPPRVPRHYIISLSDKPSDRLDHGRYECHIQCRVSLLAVQDEMDNFVKMENGINPLAPNDVLYIPHS